LRPSDEVFFFDPAKETVTKIDVADGSSIVREGASIEYDAVRGALYLYGGSSGTVLHNDLWKLDLRSKLWTQVLPECSTGTCPPQAADSLIVRDSVTGNIELLPGVVSASKQIYYVAGKYGWTGQAEVEGSPRVSDCNGDGVAEDRYGILCSTGTSWWAAPGKMVCDTFTGGLACSTGAAQGNEVGRINLPSATSFHAHGNLLWATKANRMETYNVSDPSHAGLLSSLILPGRARDVTLSGGYAFVASDRRVLVVDVSDAASPFVVSELSTCGQAKNVAVTGTTLAVASSGGLGLVDISDPREPAGLGMLWVMETGPHVWTYDGLMEECAMLCEGEQAVVDLVFSFSDFGRSLEADGGSIFAASRIRLMSFGVSRDKLPVLLDDMAYRRAVENMRIYGPYAYVNLAGGRTSLIRISETETLEEIGAHEVAWWVKGVEIEGERAYILDGNRLKIAQVMPSWGWIW
jgi:hypothetical protein